MEGERKGGSEGGIGRRGEREKGREFILEKLPRALTHLYSSFCSR